MKKNKPTIAIFDYFFVLRPTLFFPVWTVFLAGHWASFRFDPGLSHTQRSLLMFFSLKDLMVCLLLTLLMGAIFLINQIADIESDRLNNKLFLIANEEISRNAAYMETLILLVIAITGVSFIRIELTCAFLATLLVTGMLYSIRPFSFKNHIWGGMLINMIGAPLIFSIGWLVNGAVRQELVLHTLPYATAIVGIFLLTTLPDVEGDRKVGKITFGVRYGLRKTVYGAMIFEILTNFFAVMVKDWVILIPAGLALGFFVRAAWKLDMASVLKAIRWSVLFISLMVCVRYPVYLLFLVVNFYLSKWYYRKRFNLAYPSFKTRG